MLGMARRTVHIELPTTRRTRPVAPYQIANFDRWKGPQSRPHPIYILEGDAYSYKASRRILERAVVPRRTTKKEGIL